MTTQFATRALAEARLHELEQRIAILLNRDRLDWSGLGDLRALEAERTSLRKALENWEAD